MSELIFQRHELDLRYDERKALERGEWDCVIEKLQTRSRKDLRRLLVISIWHLLLGTWMVFQPGALATWCGAVLLAFVPLPIGIGLYERGRAEATARLVGASRA